MVDDRVSGLRKCVVVFYFSYFPHIRSQTSAAGSFSMIHNWWCRYMKDFIKRGGFDLLLQKYERLHGTRRLWSPVQLFAALWLTTLKDITPLCQWFYGTDSSVDFLALVGELVVGPVVKDAKLERRLAQGSIPRVRLTFHSKTCDLVRNQQTEGINSARKTRDTTAEIWFAYGTSRWHAS